MSIKKKLLAYSFKKKNVYIIPSRTGFRYVIVNFSLFIMAMVYTNNLALLISFFMITYFILQMFNSHKIINDISFKELLIHNGYANESIPLQVNFQNEQMIETQNLIHCNLINKDKVEIKAKFDNSIHPKKISFKIKKLNRSSHNLEYIKFYSLGSTKLFYVWRYFPIKETLFIYPQMIQDQLQKESESNSQGKLNREESEFTEHKKYLPGNSSKRIDWKIYARSDALYTKEFQNLASQEFEINFFKVTGKTEEKLSKMSYLIRQAHQSSSKYKVILTEETIPLNDGYEHFIYCMRRLSEF